MTKKQYIEYIHKVYYEFLNQKNHGGRGNWWYPSQCTFAYKVKMYNFADIKTLRKYLTALQNDYYTDDSLLDYIYEEQNSTCEFLIEDLKEMEAVRDVNFAGRSGGWIEVTYYNPLSEFIDEYEYTDIKDIPLSDVKYYYKKAKELEAEEVKISEYIKKLHKDYNNYIDSDGYYKDIADVLICDDDIKEIYKNKVEYYNSIIK